MPVRSLTSSVLKWPDRETVDHAIRRWTATEAKLHQGLIQLGYFGSYARGDWGVGSDLDLIAIERESSEPFERRSLSWDLTSLPVPAELIIYTEKEWKAIQLEETRFARMLAQETIWLYKF